MRKREKFILSASLLSIGLLFVQFVPLQFRFIAILGFFFISYAISAWSLVDDLRGSEWVTVVPFPAFYAVAVSLFYFLLPESWLSRIAVLVLFGVGMYGLYLTSNIYSVAKVRTIQLLRAAHAIGFLFTLFTLMLFANTIFSFHWPFWLNGLGVALSSFPLVFMFLWSTELKPAIERGIILQSAAISLVLGEAALVLSFFPATIWVSSLAIVAIAYSMLGILQSHMTGRLFRNTVWEYIIASVIVFAAFFLLIQWK